MFDDITFTTTTTSRYLSSRNLTEKDLNNPKYSRENLENSKFFIVGSVDHFHKPPIPDFALKNLLHMQDFNVFHYGSGSFTERQNYHSFLVLYTYSGQGALTYRGKTYTLSEGDGFFINCMEHHSYRVVGKHWDTGVLHFYGPLLSELHEQYMQMGSAVFHESIEGKFQHYLERLLLLYEYPHTHRDWQVSTCLDIMLTHLLLLNTGEDDVPQYIRSLLKYMGNNYTSHLTLDTMAAYAHMDKYYLSKRFKQYTGFSPNEYIISLRIEQAKNLLKTTMLPAAQIAHEVGIHDMNNFTKLFKKKTGQTPIQYRRNGDIFL